MISSVEDLRLFGFLDSKFTGGVGGKVVISKSINIFRLGFEECLRINIL